MASTLDRSKKYRLLYGMHWPIDWHPADIEMDCIRRGGKWKKSNGDMAGEGLFFHHKKLQTILDPAKVWHKWNDLLLEKFIGHRIIGVIGPASSGKTREAADFARMSYYIWPYETTIIVSSTERETLEDRVWGEIKSGHRAAKRIHPDLPGYLIESRQRLVTDDREDTGETGLDMRSGIVGVPCFLSGTLVDTPSGSIPIEMLKVGQQVFNAFGIGKITQTHNRVVSKALRVNLSDGRTIDCTEEHPFFTQKGWVKAVDLTTCDEVFSAHETMRIMWSQFDQTERQFQSQILLRQVPSFPNLYRLRKSIRGGVSKSKILHSKLCPVFGGGNSMRSMRPTFSPNETAANEEPGPLLQFCLRRKVGGVPEAFKQKTKWPLLGMQEDYEQSSLQSSILLHRMQESADNFTVQIMRKAIHFNQARQHSSKDSILQRILQAEVYWEGQCKKAHYSNPRGIYGLEIIPGCHCSLPPKNGSKDCDWEKSLVSARYSISELETGGGHRRRGSQHSIKENQRSETNQYPARTWVDSIEILESRGDPRFNESEGGYRVHNIAVDTHPSYSVNGVIVHNCKKGGAFVGVSAFAGRKNKRVMLIADEGQFMPRAYVDALSNLNKNKNFKAIVLGNPKETTDALGIICEPSADLGGWDGGIDQGPKTKFWTIRFPEGICVQLVGSDSPNLDGKLGIPLINQEQIDADIAFYGKDSLQFTMMDEGKMPRGQGLRRVITRQMCLKFGAMDPPIWKSEKRTKIFFIDAAYGRVGGDRCIGGELQFGTGLDKDAKEQEILALIDAFLIPVSALLPEMPEDQIVLFAKTQCEQRGIPPENLFFDSTGRGTLMSAFARLWSPSVGCVEFGGVPSDRQVSKEIDVTCREYYKKFVSELWYSARLIIEACQFRGLTEEVMLEGCQREWGFVAGNKIEVETKDEMKLKSGRSPDLFDGLVAGIEGARRRGFVITRGGISGLLRSDLWKRDFKNRGVAIRKRYELTETT